MIEPIPFAGLVEISETPCDDRTTDGMSSHDQEGSGRPYPISTDLHFTLGAPGASPKISDRSAPNS